MTLLHATEESETRILTRAGTVVILLVVIAAVVYFAVDPFGRKPRDLISIAVETPFVSQGIVVGTPVIMHGVTIGQVSSVSSVPGGGVRLTTDLQPGLTRGLTDAMGIDFRPANYFGVTGINVIPAPNGQPLQNGMQISINPKGNFALQALVYRLGELSNGVFNQRLVSVIERTTRYADGLNPLLETMLIVGSSIAKAQTVSAEQLLRNATGISIAFPGFIDAITDFGYHFVNNAATQIDADEFVKNYKYYAVFDEQLKRVVKDNLRFLQNTMDTDEYWNKQFVPISMLLRLDVFASLGNLEGSHLNDLYPAVESVRALADTVPQIVSPDSFAYTITEMRSRFERMYGGSGDQRALQVRIVLDRLPAVAAPLGMMTDGS